MKRLLIVTGIVSVLFFGCSNPVENPIESVNSQSSVVEKAYVDGTNSPVDLPYELFVEKAINGASGGFLELKGQYINAFGDVVTVDSRLSIPANSFFGIKVISIRTDPYRPTLIFEPGSFFNNLLKLDVKFVGIQLERYDLQSGKTNFVCLGDNGSIEVVKVDGLSVDLSKRSAEVKGAKVQHFSRYGFIRKAPSEASSTQ